MKHLFRILAVLTLCASAQAATVTGLVQQITGTVATNVTITFSNLTTPYTVGAPLVISTPKPATTKANGWFSNELVTGWYKVFVGSNPRDTVTVYIPDTNAVLNLWDYRTNGFSVAVATPIFQVRSEKGQANGYAPLGSDGLVPDAYLPAASGGGSLAIKTNGVNALVAATTINFANGSNTTVTATTNGTTVTVAIHASVTSGDIEDDGTPPDILDGH